MQFVILPFYTLSYHTWQPCCALAPPLSLAPSHLHTRHQLWPTNNKPVVTRCIFVLLVVWLHSISPQLQAEKRQIKKEFGAKHSATTQQIAAKQHVPLAPRIKINRARKGAAFDIEQHSRCENKSRK